MEKKPARSNYEIFFTFLGKLLIWNAPINFRDNFKIIRRRSLPYNEKIFEPISRKFFYLSNKKAAINAAFGILDIYYKFFLTEFQHFRNHSLLI